MNELIDWYQFFADNRIKIELYKHSYQNLPMVLISIILITIILIDTI